MCPKWPSTPLYCSKTSLRGLKEKVFFIAKRGEAKNLKCRKIYHCVPYVRASSELTARLCFTGAQLAGLATKCLLPGQLPTCTCRTGLRNRTVRRAMGKRVRWWRRGARCAQHLPTKWLPTPLYCSKKSLRGLEEKAFFHCKGGGAPQKTPK